ncbi:hypothetical protein E4O05_02400 [Treponema sp. OMZ 787]|nr:hypothetical protein [Treponema sp. OMZ 787]UTC62768.1 hypothetical protein E4O05_02400 [Treponema sp. OMZ 787]
MKTLFKLIKSNRRNGIPQKSEILTPQEKIREQVLVWKSNLGNSYFTI